MFNCLFSIDGADTADSLEIKPPQATIGRGGGGSGGSSDLHHRYKEKKSRDKKHSKERRHKEKNRMRERSGRSDRHRGSGSGGGTHRSDRERDRDRDRADNRERHHHQQLQQQQQQQMRQLSIGNDVRYEMHARERDYYRHMYKERDRGDKIRIKEQHESKRRESPQEKSDAERALEDLRSRLLSKRNKHDQEKRFEEQHDTVEYRQERMVYRQNQYEYKKSSGSGRDDSRKDYSHHQKHRSRKNIIEVIDSPEMYAEFDVPLGKQQQQQQQQHKESSSSKQPKLSEDPELVARRAKLLDAEREMAKRKELARNELEARREMRRERGGDQMEYPMSPPIVNKKRRHASSDVDDDDVEQRKKTRDGGAVVNVSDNSADDTASDTDTNSNTDSDDGEESDKEVPISPLSVGELSKSERRRRSHSHSRSRSSKSRSPSPYHRSRSRSRSKSRSRTPSRSPQLRNRSRPASPDSDFEKDKNPDRPMDDEIISNKKDQDTTGTAGAAADAKAAIDQLPNYFPGIQGCRSVEEFQCLNRIEEGTYGVVYRARDKRTEEIVALKRLKMEKEKEGFPITSLREINTLLKGQHPNIVTVREIVVGSNMDKIFIVMDYVEHDLKSLMETMKHRKQGFLPTEVKCLTQQLLRAVGHLHDNWILHRDLKTSNLLLSHKGILKVWILFQLTRRHPK